MYAHGVEAFLAVVQTSSISGAARQLNLSQPTISKRLKLLEEELQIALFERERGAKAVTLTDAGVAFLSTAERWVELWRETKLIRFKESRLSLTIGSMDSLNYAVFPPLYKALSLHQPRICLQVITAHSREFYEKVAQRQVDIAFTYVAAAHPSVNVETCYSDPVVGLCLPESDLAREKSVHPRDLDPNFELYTKWGTNYEIWHDNWWPPYCHNRITVDTTQLTWSFFYDARQWAITPYSVARVALAKGGFNMFYLQDPPPERVCYKLTNKVPKKSTQPSIDVLNACLEQLVRELDADTERVRAMMRA